MATPAAHPHRILSVLLLLSVPVLGGACGPQATAEDDAYQVWDLIVAGDAWYYTRMNFEESRDWGVPELWRIMPDSEEPELVSKAQQESCAEGPVFGDWHPSPEGASVTATCWGEGRFAVWEYGERPDRVQLVHESDASPGEELVYASTGVVYRFQGGGTMCKTVEVETAEGDASAISDVLTEAAGAVAVPECRVPLVTQDMGLDADGDLWAVLDADGIAVCEYDLGPGTAACTRPEAGDCLEFEVSLDGTRFACASDAEEDRLHLSVFDAATGALAAELDIPDSGAWTFADAHTIVRLGHDLEAEEHALPA